MTVQQAADLWRVNRRTILKWIMGKDASGRGKRLVEGEDYEVLDADVDGRKMYVLLRETYPVPTNTAPIPRIRRGPRQRPEGEEGQVVEAVEPVDAVEPVEPVVPRAEDRYNRADDERYGAMAVYQQPEVAPEPESIPMAQPETVIPVEPVEVVAPQPKPRPRRVVREEEVPTIDSDLPIQRERRTKEEIEEEKAARVIRVESVEPDPAYVGKTLRKQFEMWVPTVSNEPMDLADPVAAIARVTLREAMIDSDTTDYFEFGRLGQARAEFHLRRVLERTPMSREARAYAGGAVLEFLSFLLKNKFKLTPSGPNGYWPKQGQLSGFAAVRYLPPYDWMM